jgi:hypothetical protein
LAARPLCCAGKLLTGNIGSLCEQQPLKALRAPCGPIPQYKILYYYYCPPQTARSMLRPAQGVYKTRQDKGHCRSGASCLACSESPSQKTQNRVLGSNALIGPWLGVFGAGSQDMGQTRGWLGGVRSTYPKSGSWVTSDGSGCQRQSDR